MRTVLFVCSGNTCRSPMAEALARHWLENEPPGDIGEVFVASAGVSAAEGLPPTQESLSALKDRGIQHEGLSKTLTAEMIQKADLIFCMTASHVAAIWIITGDDNDEKIMRLDPDADVQDPIGSDQSAYDALADHFMDLIPKRLKEKL